MKKKILFIYTNYLTFVRTDFEILSSKHDVTKYQFKPVKGLFKNAYQLLKQLVVLVMIIWKFNAVYIWFADYHSFLPVLFAKILKKKSFVVIGGYDVARISSSKYGVFSSKFRGYCALFSMKTCSLNIAVSRFVERKVKWIAKNSNTRLVYNCVNLSDNKNVELPKEDLIITVGHINSERTFRLKGIDTFIEVARLLPEYKFMIIGMNKNLKGSLLKSLPQNIRFIEPVKHKELEYFYKKAKIYCQFSRSESFGVSIIEAMNFGSVPIITNVGGMPEVIGQSGKIVRRDVSHIAEEVKTSITLFENRNPEEEITSKFSLEMRSSLIISIIS